jgi:hypothetical protein
MSRADTTSKVATKTFRQTAAQYEELARNTPETMRALAERHIAHTRDVYERSRVVLEAVLDSWEKTFGATGQGASALNRKVIDIAQRNINSGFDLAKDLAGAKTLAEAMELQAAHWRKQLDALSSQAEEVRALSEQVTAGVAESIKAQVQRGVDQARKAI